LARLSDHPDDQGTLPQPDLNPLLNPLLSRNLGRWAEVYFTAPPERRAEAVFELLRKLHEEPQTRPEQFAHGSVACPACGAENPADHRFCGMCGRALRAQADHPAEAPAPAVGSTETSRECVQTESTTPPQAALEAPSEVANVPAAPSFSLGNEHLQRLRDSTAWNAVDPIPESETTPRRFGPRVYVGAVLIILAGVLGYFSTRGTGKWSRAPHAVPATTAAPAVEPRAPDMSPAQTNEDRAAQSTESTASETTHAQKDSEPSAVPTSGHAVQTASLRDSTVARDPQSPATSQDGTEELDVAKNYLAGGPERTHDSSEAAKWLWKAVAKQNVQATLLLSDLYLRGDGVPQSCDQARVLLDAAARKNSAGAAGRLRNLQAFGCQ
jgi:hypothetical protein